MIKIDVHNHSRFSADGIDSLEDMVAEARRKGVRYYGVSDHFDYDYRALRLKIRGEEIPYIDEAAYFSAARALQTRVSDENFRLLVGGEFGFSPLARCTEEYGETIGKFQPDFVVNSVHTCDGQDCYFPEAFEGKTKEYAYRRYLERVRESLDAPYRYEIVAHIGYVSRYAPFPDRKIRYEEFSDAYDDILRTIVAKGKILEINSSSASAGSDFLPDTDVLTRYFGLGGRKVSFGSDAHQTARVAEKGDLVVSALRAIGFRYFTVPAPDGELRVDF